MAKKIEEVQLLIKLTAPPGSNAHMVANYVREAVKSHCGGLDPQDEMFELDRNTVRVSLVSKTTVYGRSK